MHSNIIVWCGFTEEMIICPIFCENVTPKEPVPCSVTEEKYRHMLNNFVIPSHQQRQCLNKILFIQDVTTTHIALRVQRILRGMLVTTEIVISHCFLTAWLLRPPPCGFWLRGYLRYKVNLRHVPYLGTLKDTVSWAVQDIQTHYFLLLWMLFTECNMRSQKSGHMKPELNALNKR